MIFVVKWSKGSLHKIKFGQAPLPYPRWFTTCSSCFLRSRLSAPQIVHTW